MYHTVSFDPNPRVEGLPSPLFFSLIKLKGKRHPVRKNQNSRIIQEKRKDVKLDRLEGGRLGHNYSPTFQVGAQTFNSALYVYNQEDAIIKS